jgi:hypothetical protein
VADYLDPVVIELEGRDRKLLDTLTRAKAEVRRFTDEVGRMNATIKVDVKLKDGALAEVRRRIAESPAAKLKVDLQLGAGQRDQLRAQLEGRPIQATVKPVMDQTALRRVQMVLQELGRRIDVQIRPQMDQRSQRRVQSRLDDLSRNRTVTIRTRVTGDANRLPGNDRGGAGGGGLLAAVLPFAPALVPIAAEATAVAAAVGAATVALGAFGLAVKGQIGTAQGLADAQGKYNQAVAKYGPASQQAVQAQNAWLSAVQAADPATRRAGAALQILNDSFRQWSKSLAGDTMPVFTKGLAVAGALLPRLTPLAKSASVQLDRVVTALGGAISTPGFDRLMNRFSTFTNGVLKSATDSLIHFMRVLAEGGGSSGFSEFMAYAKANAPLVKDTLKNLGEAIMNILRAASQAGPGMLSLVNALAKIVAALPPSVLATILQVVAAFKLLALAKTGVGALSTTVQSLSTRFTAMRTAASGATGGLARLRAAFSALSTAGKATVIIAAIAAVTVAIAKLASLGQKAPPDVDKMTNALGRLGQNGQVKGEALKDYGKNLSGLRDSIKSFVAPSVLDNIQQGLVKVLSFGTTDSTPFKEAKQSFDAIDQSLANLVQNGHAKEAAAALESMKAAYAKGGHDVTNFTKNLGEYKKAVDDAKFADELTAQSMGLFGDQAIAVQQKLAAQKQTADGLVQSIMALNDVNRQAAGGQIAMEAAIDAANKAAKDNGRTLDVNTEKGRANRTALLDVASTTDDYVTKLLEQGASWDTVNAAAARGRENLIASAIRMGATGTEAKRLADQYLKIPSQVKTFAEFVKAQAESDLAKMKAKLAAFPKDKKTRASFAYQQAAADVRFYQHLIDQIHGKTVTVQINGVATGVNAAQYYSQGPHKAGGGLISGPGSSTSDDVPAMLSDGEYVVNAAATRRNRGLLEAINSGQIQHLARGGLSQAAKDARSALSGQFGISGFGRMAGYQRTPFEHNLAAPTDVNALVSALNGLHSQIKAAFSGRTESSLLNQLAKAGKSLINYDKQLTKVTASLESAKSKLDGLKQSAAQLKDSVASSIMQGAGVVTQAPQQGFGLTSQDVLNNMSAQVSKALTFSSQLQQLKKRGLSGDLLNQIASAGVDQGGETAAALVGASDAQLKQLNSMQSQLKSSANAAGSAVSDAMYGAGIRAAEGLVKGLEKKQKAIEDAMLRIAKSMESAIKRALGIKSPSTVMARLGDFTALGMAQGIDRSSKHAVIAARGMAMSVAQGAALTGTPTWAGVSATGGRGGSGGTVVHQHFEFHIEGNVMTVDKLSKDVEAAFLRRGMRNPVTYPAYKR